MKPVIPIRRKTPGISANWKEIEERVGVGAILNALQFLETDLEKELRQIQEDLMSSIDFTEGKFYTEPATGRVVFKSWEQIEEEIDPDIADQKRQIKSFFYNKDLSYAENLKNREVVLKRRIKNYPWPRFNSKKDTWGKMLDWSLGKAHGTKTPRRIWQN